MRSAEQIGATVTEWHELQDAQRARCLTEGLRMLDAARRREAEWYVWIRDVWGPFRRGETAAPVAAVEGMLV